MGIELSFIDKAIILTYFLFVLVVGVVMSKVAAKGIDNYFLGGRSIPWWVLGASGSASNFDMTGTMLIVSLFYVLGLKGFWIEMRGGVGLPLAFLMVFLGKWYRRSKVMTEAEFMRIRFGKGKGGKFARVLSAVVNIIMSIGFIIYFAVGTGTFLSQFLPFSREVSSLIMVLVGLAYTVSSGLYGVVFTDVIQELMLMITALYISVKAFFLVPNLHIPEKLTSFALPYTINVKNYEIFHFFSFVVMFYILKGILEGMGGLGGYMSQRYYAARNEKEAGLMTLEWIVLLTIRWTMIIGITVMGLTLASKVGSNPETVLPLVLKHMIPEGLKGVAIAGLIAAAMSTFDSTINAGSSYFVKDIYQYIINPNADSKQLMKVSYITSISIALIGVFLGFFVPNINAIWSWITGAFLPGMLVLLVLRWFWARFNGFGFAWGAIVGITAALFVAAIYPSAPPYITFPVSAGFSLIAAIIATYLTPAVEEEVLKEFYKKVRVGGLWDNIKRKFSYKFIKEVTIEHLNDIISVALALPFQISLFIAGITFILHDWMKFSFAMSIVCFTGIGLYFFWYKNLRDPEKTGELEELQKEEEEREKLAERIWQAQMQK